jgi:hypothetical protein
LAEHFVVLRDLLVVAAIRNVGIKLRHVAEQLVAFDDIGVAVQYPEGREGALALFHFLRHFKLPGFRRYRQQNAPQLRVAIESNAADLNKIVAIQPG